MRLTPPASGAPGAAARPSAAAADGARTDATDAELFARVRERGDAHARERLIERYLPLVRRLARRYQHAEEPLDDLVQVGSVGLIKAIDRFDTKREVVFSSYAVPTILGELKRHFRDSTWSVRVPRDLQELALRVDRAVTHLSVGRHRSPSVSEIARAVDASEERVLDALEAAAAYRAASLDAPRAAAGGEEAGESIADTLGVEEAGFAHAEEKAMLAPLLARITPRERLVLQLRFAEDLTQAEIGERIGVSQMQVSRLIRQALVRMRAGEDGA
ncbi:MAG TPA: SigB/SigF/SigG family RNA polymerase sigma factor [Solirubrobacteraceae bacterium]|jgi:RNA polymerase sigma-B factor|nr:SigB/SigF/SigG family RNA polymerase sigma factor [Solirubrobacteraceae bacterium]